MRLRRRHKKTSSVRRVPLDATRLPGDLSAISAVDLLETRRLLAAVRSLERSVAHSTGRPAFLGGGSRDAARRALRRLGDVEAKIDRIDHELFERLMKARVRS